MGVGAEPNGIIPLPPPTGNGPDRNCRQLNCPVPVAHRGGGSAEVALEAAFSYKMIKLKRVAADWKDEPMVSKKMKKDTLFKEKKDPVPAFEFNENVAQVFDDMINRSVPLYQECVQRQAELAVQFYQKGTRIYDLGCSHGNFGMTFYALMKQTAFDMVAVDSSRHMLERYAHRLKEKNTASAVSLICDLAENIVIDNASVVVLNLTLQFIPPSRRQALIQSIYDGLCPGGLLLLTEKIIHENNEINLLQQQYYKKFKRENGYSEMEISQKRDALEDVLVPDTLEIHRQRLHEAGFTHMDIWLKWFNFTAILAIK